MLHLRRTFGRGGALFPVRNGIPLPLSPAADPRHTVGAMRTDDFDFPLPPTAIAHQPARPRDSARLLRVRADGLGDHVFTDLPGLLDPGDLLIINDTRVIPARLWGRRGLARIEVTLHQALALTDSATARWRAFARPAKRLRVGDRLDFAADFAADIVEKGEMGEVTLEFGVTGPVLLAALHRHGAMPLPPYIKRPDGPDPADRADYQTLFAARDGAVAAPTASLHMTPAVMAALAGRGVEVAALTLHVGAGTFLPVKTDDPASHPMHAEYGILPAATVAAIRGCRARGGRVVAAGTTVLRLLESAALAAGSGSDGLAPFAGETRLLVLPGFRFQVVDRLLTNFHLPKSTLFMLVCAFAGIELMRSAYSHAIQGGYRFYSYGDSSLLDRRE